MAKCMTATHTFQEFEALIGVATVKAEKAAGEWLIAAQARGPKYGVHVSNLITGENGPVVGQMLDLCGGAFISFTDKRDLFYKHVKKVEIEDMVERGHQVKYYQGPYSLHIRHKYSGRQEMGLNSAAARAAFQFLSDEGIKNLSYREYID